MIITGIIDEDFVNYKMPSMVVNTSYCDFKCERDCGVECCQNERLAQAQKFAIDDDRIISRYLNNPITKAIVFGGLEPLDQFAELTDFLRKLRTKFRCTDTVVIYTGYQEEEVGAKIKKLECFGNIIVKFGRYVPNQQKHYDDVLGVELASPNQYAKEL